MATIINNPAPTGQTTDSGGGAGMIIGVVVALVVIALALYFIVPAMRGGSPVPANNPAPSGSGENGTTVEIPDTVNLDVNVK